MPPVPPVLLSSDALLRRVAGNRITTRRHHEAAPPDAYRPDFDPGKFRYAAALYANLLIRARWKCEPGFLAEADLAAWGLEEIGTDRWPAWRLLGQAAAVLGTINTQFVERCGSGGVRAADESTPEGRLVYAVSFLASTEGGGPEHNGALVEASRQLREGGAVDWPSLVAWETLPAIRADLDLLPHPVRDGGATVRPEGEGGRPAPSELSRRDAARYLGISVETLLEFQRGGLLRYRNASPPGSGKPRYRYPVEDLDRLMREGYRRDTPRPRATRTSGRGRQAPQRYEHLDLG